MFAPTGAWLAMMPLLKSRRFAVTLVLCLGCAFLLSRSIGDINSPRLIDAPDPVPLRSVMIVFVGSLPAAMITVGVLEQEHATVDRVFGRLAIAAIAVLCLSALTVQLASKEDTSGLLRNMLISAVATLIAAPVLGALSWLVPVAYAATCILLATTAESWWAWPLASHAPTAEVLLWAGLFAVALAAMWLIHRRWPMMTAAAADRW